MGLSMSHNFLQKCSTYLLLLGGLLWGVLAAFNVDALGALFHDDELLNPASRIVYVLIGLAALYRSVMHAASAAQKK